MCVRTGVVSFDLSHDYDPVGNRLREIDNGTGAITTYSYDAANQLRTSEDATGTSTYAYDGAGHLRTVTAPGGITTSTWDAVNRRSLVQLPSGIVNTFLYDGDGLRIQKQDSTGTTRFVWDGQNYLSELDGSNSTKALYTQTPDTYGILISGKRGPFPTDYYQYDGLGSVAAITWSSITLKSAYAYKAFGESIDYLNLVNTPFRWVGQLGYYRDADLLEYYLRARTYSPALARFLSQDPLGFGSGDFNLYRYVFNNPVNATDPSGLMGKTAYCNGKVYNAVLQGCCNGKIYQRGLGGGPGGVGWTSPQKVGARLVIVGD